MSNIPYIQSMRGSIQRARGYAQDGFELVVTVSFDAKQFNRIKTWSDPLAHGMAQLKNVVMDATGIRSMPSYARASYVSAYPRARKGLVTLTLYFECNEFTVRRFGGDCTKYNLFVDVDLQSVLDATRGDGHLFAKSAIAKVFGGAQ